MAITHEYTYMATVERVVDGDTIYVLADLGFEVYRFLKLRLYGIDTPETRGVKKGSPEFEAGMAATDFVWRWLREGEMANDKPLVCIRSYDGKQVGAGKYGRWLVEVYRADGSGQSLNALLLKTKHAVACEY